MIVKNLNGTSKSQNCPCGSWIEHWKLHIGFRPERCSVIGCSETPTDGGHVQYKEGNDNQWYIIPLCEKHNRWPQYKGQELDIYRDTKLVPAVNMGTCGRNK